MASQNVARTLLRSALIRRCPVATLSVQSNSLPSSSAPCTPLLFPCHQKRLYASKKKSQRASRTYLPDPDSEPSDEGDVPVLQVKGKKGKGKDKAEPQMIGDKSLPDESFDLGKLEESMERTSDRLKVNVNQLVARVGRVTPALLDHVRVELKDENGKLEKYPLSDFASVKVQGMDALLVNLYDESNIKEVLDSLSVSSPISNSLPQKVDSKTIRVPVPKPDLASRNALAKQLSGICENARVSIRAARHQGQKEIKKDVDNGVVSGEEGRKEGKKLQDTVNKYTSEVDTIHDKAKKILLDE